MAFRLFRQGDKDPNVLIADVRADLKTARQHLTNKQNKEALALFKDVENRLIRHIGKAQPTDKLSSLLGEARLGIWGARYLDNSCDIGAYQSATNLFSSDSYWLRFVVYVLNIKQDATPAAAGIYLRYLQSKQEATFPTEFLRLLNTITGQDRNAPAEVQEMIVNRLAELTVHEAWVYQRSAAFALRRGELNPAEQYLRQADQLFPDDPGIQRMLGYIAEKSENFADASLRYRKAEEWLRLGIVCVRLGDYDQAAQNLDQVRVEDRADTWFYYKGLTCFKKAWYEECLKIWGTLAERQPQDKDLKAQIGLAKGHLVFASFRKAIECLIKDRQPTSAKPLLQQVMGIYPDQATAKSWLGLCMAVERTDDIDKKLYTSLRENVGTGALFLVLRGIWLLQDNPVLSFRYFERAFKELPPSHQWRDITAAGAFLAYQSALSGNQQTALDFQWATSAFSADPSNTRPPEAISGVVHLLRLEGYDTGIKLDKPLVSTHIALQALDYAIQGNAEKAFTTLQEQSLEGWSANIRPKLAWELVTQLHAYALRDRRWNDSFTWVTEGLAIKPDHRELTRQQSLLAEFGVQNLLAKKDWKNLTEHYLSQLRHTPENVQYHFNLALCYTAQAQDSDEKHVPDFTLWDRAIGHWATVLVNTEFWAQWKLTHQASYGAEITEEALERLRSEIIPDRYRVYHQEQVNSSTRSKRYAYYAALLPVEVNAAKAIGTAIKKGTAAGKPPVPEEIVIFPSPSLLKSWGFDQIAWQFVGGALRGDEHKLVRDMLSPLGQIHALMSAGQIGEALELLREHISSESNAESQSLFGTLVQQRNEQLLEAGHFEEVRTLAHEALRLSDNPSVRNQLALATARWSRGPLNEGRFEEAVTELRRTASSVPGNPELQSTLAEALIRWGQTLIIQGRTQPGLDRVQEGLNADRNNQAVKQIAAVAYHDAAVEDFNHSVQDLHSVNLSRALGYVSKAVELDPSNQNKEFLSMVHYRIALQAGDQNLWLEAAQHAQEAFNLNPTEETGRFWVATEHDWSLALYRQNRFTDAIQVAENGFGRALKLAEISGDDSILHDMNFGEILSIMYNDLGASFAHANRRWDAQQCFETALKYNSSNTMARQNLRLVRGY
jgi:tetratricopeptide (TPR) repeat protein